MVKIRIEFQDAFFQKLQGQAKYISKDKPEAARKFKKAIIDECKSLCNNPFRCRKSIYYNDENIRDLILLGYTIIYEVSDEAISIFAMTKYENYKPSEQ